jgi:uncharacterized protein (DUF885 family)
MKKFLLFFFAIIALSQTYSQQKADNKVLATLFSEYTEASYQLFPLRATLNGDARYNDLLPVSFTDSYNKKTAALYNEYLTKLQKFDRASLNQNDQISYDVFKRDMEIGLEGLSLKANRIPFNQFDAFELQMGQLGSGTGAQPFKTVKDYDNWISRAKKYVAWSDSNIVYFKKGIAEGIVLPRALVIKMIPQMQALQKADPKASVFYGPVNNFPASFNEADKSRLTEAFKDLINNYLNPAYKKLEMFLRDEYLAKARASSGIGSVPEGDKIYRYAIRLFTTTNQSPDQLFNTGLAEVKRIREEMEGVRKQVNYQGTLEDFFTYTKTDPKFLPYKNAEEVLVAYRAIQQKLEPYLNNLFTMRPKTSFEVRQTEAFRAASAAAQYNAGLPDGSRPGIFYVPIVDATKYTTAKECLFIHEAIPGHHFQIMLQRENKTLPAFRQNGGNSAFSEGWGLYCESLGKQLGCYTDPYQYFDALGAEIHRAIRLVVDAGMHAKGWTREQAIEYMMKNESITEQSATAEIERYMARPGQALSYKVGELKIKELRNKYSKELGSKFKLTDFHNEILKDGSIPLSVLETKMAVWAKTVGSKP